MWRWRKSYIRYNQMRIQNPVKHLISNVLRKQLFEKELFSQKAPSQMFDRVLTTSLIMEMSGILSLRGCVDMRAIGAQSCFDSLCHTPIPGSFGYGAHFAKWIGILIHGISGTQFKLERHVSNLKKLHSKLLQF